MGPKGIRLRWMICKTQPVIRMAVTLKAIQTINAMSNIDAEYEALCAEYALTSV